MAADPRNGLPGALADLTEGVRALLGLEESAPELVGELLEGRRAHRGAGARERLRASPLPTRAGRRGAGRTGGSSKSPLVLVKGQASP